MDLVSPDCLGSKKDFTNGISNPMMRGQKSTATDYQKAEVGKGGRGATVRAWAGADWLAHRTAEQACRSASRPSLAQTTC
jgi:hypothetical protein